ncbi:hypothetical protein LRAMOSA06906 [Lichtheimia ramosa]|uniref:Uncharacterized protein n=1 Tax=Lichtheimia ramosa TaxID=688394 RepID=A0A077WA94_9FUNG|nr:hypothetical protein LRAMOSA06906 [Lichtheimia ramosa]
MKFPTFSSLLLALLLIGTVCAAPLEDVSVTSIDLAEERLDAKGDEHLYVTVTRTDDLIDDDGILLAERVMAVQVTFDVAENHQLRCNGVPVEIGVSSIQVEAQIAANPEKLTIASEEDLALLEDSFDIGLATVEVNAMFLDELKTEDGLSFRRIAVQERITEINGEQVVQTEAGQQILDVFEDGQLNRWAVDPLTGFLLPSDDDTVLKDEPAVVPAGHSNKGCAGALVDPLVDWWNNQSFAIQGLITGGICAVLLAIALAIRQMIVSSNDYDPVAVVETNEEIWSSVQHKGADYEEKRPFLS